MKKNFTGPFWLLLVFGLLQLLLISVQLYSLLNSGWSSINSYAQSLITPMFLLRTFMWPAITLAEALVYWLIRRRNKYRALSWAHSVIYVLAFLLNIFFFTVLAMYCRRLESSDIYRINEQIRMHVQQLFFWSLFLLAHVAFVAVLANCFRKTDPVEETVKEGPENILDDVVL